MQWFVSYWLLAWLKEIVDIVCFNQQKLTGIFWVLFSHLFATDDMNGLCEATTRLAWGETGAVAAGRFCPHKADKLWSCEENRCEESLELKCWQRWHSLSWPSCLSPPEVTTSRPLQTSDLPAPKLANVIALEGVLSFLPFLLLLHRKNVKSECNFISLQLRQCDCKTRSKCKFQTKIKVRYIETKSFFFQTLLRCVQGRRAVVWTDTTEKKDVWFYLE